MNATKHENWPLPLMTGLPDDMRVDLGRDPRNGRIMFGIPGVVRLASELAPHFQNRLHQIIFGRRIELQLPPAVRGKPMINAIGDPDTSAASLRILAGFLQRMPVACFNHPVAVLDSGRERVAAKLAVLSGLQVPRTIRLRIGEPADLVRAAAEYRLGYPLLVRVAGAHRGTTTVKIDCPEQASHALRNIPWGGRDIYLTEYVEYRDEDGLYRKIRLAVVGREVFLRHLVMSRDWQVHVHDRSLGHMDEEKQALAEFESRLLPKIRSILLEVAEAMDMDYFGMDCSVRPDGRLLLFEVNPMMDILNNAMTSPNCWDTAIKRIHDELAGLLFDSSRWRHPSGRRSKSVAA